MKQCQKFDNREEVIETKTLLNRHFFFILLKKISFCKFLFNFIKFFSYFFFLQFCDLSV